MPVSADPNATCEIWLDDDADQPAQTRLTFTCRFLTRAQRTRVLELRRTAFAETDNAKCFDLLWQAISIGVVGWRNAVNGDDGRPVEAFNRETIGLVLSDQEIWDLANEYPAKVSLSETERFLSRSRSRASAAASAPPATPGAAPAAPTSPAPAVGT